MNRDEDALDRRIGELYRGELDDPVEVKEIARVLHDHIMPRIIGVLVRFGTEMIAAEEIAKEAVDKAVPSYQYGKASFTTYATKIALNIRADRYRRGLLSPSSMQRLSEDLVDVDPDVPGMEEGSSESKLIRELNPLLRFLSQEDRILIQLDIQDVPKESFMEIYGVGEAAYRQRKSRAYRRLRALYRKHYGTKGRKGEQR